MIVGYKNIGDYLPHYFKQVYPEEQFDGSVEMFLERIEESPYSLEFYLTESALGLCATGLPNAVGGYLIFEADYDAIKPWLTLMYISLLEI